MITEINDFINMLNQLDNLDNYKSHRIFDFDDKIFEFTKNKLLLNNKETTIKEQKLFVKLLKDLYKSFYSTLNPFDI